MGRTMKTLKLILPLVFILSASGVNAKTNTTETAPADPLVKAVLQELNIARTNPLKYVEFLKEYRNTFEGNVSRGADRVKWRTKEGVAAVDEAINVLSKQTPLTPLKFSEGLALAAMDHVEDTGPKGTTGHDGSDGSTSSQRVKRYGSWKKTTGENIAYGHDEARKIVMQLIVDDGVPSRGHRENIYNKNFHVAGIACGPHATSRCMCVIDFAGGYQDDTQAIRKRKSR